MNRRSCRVLAVLIIFTSFSLLCLAQEQPYYFIQLSDPQFGMYTGNRGFEQETANYEFAIATINRLNPGFVIVTGDLVNKAGDAAQMAEYLRISGKVNPTVPIYHVAGNHDVGLEPTLESLAAYRKALGQDRYSFQAGLVYAIVLNSALIYAPKNVPLEYDEQEAWLKKQLEAAKTSGAKHILVFQHHPYFLKKASERDEYANIPKERRQKYLNLLKSYGVRYVFAGHSHKNMAAKDGNLEVVISGPVGRPEGEGRSGMCIVSIRESGLQHRYYDFGALPNTLAK